MTEWVRTSVKTNPARLLGLMTMDITAWVSSTTQIIEEKR
jgi:hypothetical protein